MTTKVILKVGGETTAILIDPTEKEIERTKEGLKQIYKNEKITIKKKED